VSNRIPFAINDVLIAIAIIGVPVWWVVAIRRSGRGGRAAAVGRMAFNTLALGAAVFLSFEVTWGLNYQREPLARKVDYDRGRVTEAALIQLFNQTVTELNGLSTEAHSSEWPDLGGWRHRLEPTFEAVVTELGDSGGAAGPRAKRSLLNVYLTAAGIDGFTN